MEKLLKLAATVAIASAALFCVGCDFDGTNQAKCLESVEAEFQGGSVSMIPNQKYRFIVKDADGGIWYVETLNSGPEVSMKFRAFD